MAEGSNPSNVRRIGKKAPPQSSLQIAGYDYSNFYTASVDSQGHYRSARGVRPDGAPGHLPPQTVKAITEIVGLDQIPYNSTPEFMRDAAHHNIFRCYWLLDGKDTPIMRRARLEAKAWNIHSDREHQNQAVESFRTMLEQATNAKDWGRRKEILEIAWQLSKDLDGPSKKAMGKLIEEYLPEDERGQGE